MESALARDNPLVGVERKVLRPPPSFILACARDGRSEGADDVVRFISGSHAYARVCVYVQWRWTERFLNH